MIASTPWSTAVAASLTSARVGRGSVRIDSSTCVARITGRPSARAPRDDRLLDARDLLERTLEPEIAARHHHAVGRRQDRVEVLERLRPLDLRDERHVGVSPRA